MDRAQITVFYGSDKGKSWCFGDVGPILIGRHSRCKVRLHDRSISRIHAELKRDEVGWFVQNKSTKHGLFRNGHQLTGRTYLDDGDTLRLGDTVLWFKLVSQDQSSEQSNRQLNEESLTKSLELEFEQTMPAALDELSETEEKWDHADAVINAFEAAALLNLESPQRKGATVYPGDAGRILMTGDLRDHRGNFENILYLAALDQNKHHHLVLHEVIHGSNIVDGNDMSIHTIARVAALKIRYPKQVHILLSKYELDQIHGQVIAKNQILQSFQFDGAIERLYGEDADNVRVAMVNYVSSLPLAIKTETGLFLSHSLPSIENLDGFDWDVIHRELSKRDLSPIGDAYKLVCGKPNRNVVKACAKAWSVNLFILGSQDAPSGFRTQFDSVLILASNHDQGTALPIVLRKEYSLSSLVSAITPLGSGCPGAGESLSL